MSKVAATEDADLEVEEEVDEDEVAVTYDIASYPSDLTLSVVNEMWMSEDIVIPDFQRNFVWSIKQASLLIESFLLGLPVPQVFFYVDEHNKNQVIDGQQRIVSVVSFLDGYFGIESIEGKKRVFRLQGLGKESPFAKKRFEDLTDSQQRKLKSAVLRAINIRQLKPGGEATSVYHIFERLNTGGTPLRAQEIRNCVFRGGLVKILRSLNTDPAWRTILGKKTFDRHQKDVELVLRVFALSSRFDEYEKPLKEFLNVTMSKERQGTSEAVKTFVRKFPVVTDAIAAALGPKPFHIRGPLNASALDAVCATLMRERIPTPKELKKRYASLLADKAFKESTHISTSDLAVVTRRVKAVRRHLLA